MTALQAPKTRALKATPPAPNPVAMDAALTPLTDLISAWRKVPPGQSLAKDMTPQEIQETLSMLNQLASPGDPRQVSVIVGRMLKNFPGADRLQEDSVAEDWVRVLQDEPLASIWVAYEKHIRKPGAFAPSIGDFLTTVKSHAATVNSVRISILAGQ